MEPDLPFEFIVQGTALSLQAKKGTDAWKERVRSAMRPYLPEGAFLLSRPLAVTIYLFPQAPLSGDVDNRIKPILDAMTRSLYSDDEVVHRVVMQKFEPDYIYLLADVLKSDILLEALASAEPVVYIRLTDNLIEGVV